MMTDRIYQIQVNGKNHGKLTMTGGRVLVLYKISRLFPTIKLVVVEENTKPLSVIL